MTQDIMAEVVPIVRELREFRAPRVARPADLLARQELILCGRHAINHILQESKVDWRPANRDLLITGSRDPMNRDTHINLAQFCTTYFDYYRSAHRIPANGRMPACDLVNGPISSDVIQVLFANLLKYTVTIMGFARDRATDLRALRGSLEQHNCLGAIINIGGYHWTAVSRYMDSCRKRSGARLTKFRWADIDSLADSIYECTDSLPALFEKHGGRFVQAILIYSRPGESYYSVADNRMDGGVVEAAAGDIAGVYAAPLVPVAPAGAAADNARTYVPNNNARTFAPNNNANSVVSYDPDAEAAPVRRRPPTPGRSSAVRTRAPTPGRRPSAPAPKGILKKTGGTRRIRRSSHRRSSHSSHRRQTRRR